MHHILTRASLTLLFFSRPPQDDDEALDFVCAAANLRAFVFHIDPDSRFDVKCKGGNRRWSWRACWPRGARVHPACVCTRRVCSSQTLISLPSAAKAGNIIPAIATTNAVVAGLIVAQAFRILKNEMDGCRAVGPARAGDKTRVEPGGARQPPLMLGLDVRAGVPLAGSDGREEAALVYDDDAAQP